jgi:RNA polymerase sigma-70 factor (ECF subfamily)
MDDAAEFGRLVAGLRTGDPAAADELYRRYGGFIRAAVRRRLDNRLRTRFDSLDFVQDVWVALLAAPADRYTFDSPQALLGFLNRVAYRKVVDVFRQRFETQKADVTREQADGGELNPLRSPGPTPSQWAIAGEEWDRLLNRFPPGHRAVLERLREGHSNEEVARLTNLNLTTVNRVIRRLKDLTGM